MTDPSPFRSLDFWIAVGIALLVKIKTSSRLGPFQVITTLIVGVGSAWVATDYAVSLFNVPEPVAAAVVALTAEGLMRMLLLTINNPKHAIDLWKYWRK